MASPSSKPRILVARAVFPEVIERLAQHFEVEHNQADDLWTAQQFADRLEAGAEAVRNNPNIYKPPARGVPAL